MTQIRPTTLPVWAEAGDKAQPSNSEINNGWPNSTIPPSRQRFNWILNFLANGMRYLLQRGIAEWDSAESYPIGAKVTYGALEYKSLTANTNKQPDTNPSDWDIWGFTASNFSALKASNGYQKLPSGVIVQWASGVDQGAAGNQTITLPVAFPNGHLKTLVSNLYLSGAQNGGYGFISATTSQVTVARNNVDNGNGVTPLIISIGH